MCVPSALVGKVTVLPNAGKRASTGIALFLNHVPSGLFIFSSSVKWHLPDRVALELISQLWKGTVQLKEINDVKLCNLLASVPAGNITPGIYNMFN